MAFLDNSGDIILDAVLTDSGRRRMAEGNFRITQFALGDDEIDYGLYDKTHPSGSAYYDLVVLQTPILESFTKSNANINYGLASFNGNLNLLYLPTAKVNAVTITGDSGTNQLLQTSSVFYVSVNGQTSTALGDASAALGNSYYQKGQEGNNSLLHFETGISSLTENPPRTYDPFVGNRQLYMVTNDLIDSNFDVSVDGRFIRAVKGVLPAGSSWGGDVALGTETLMLNRGPWQPLGGNRIGLDNYKTGIIASVPNLVRGDDDGVWKNMSDINGPPGVIGLLAVRPTADLRGSAAKYALYGKVAQNLFGDGNTYDYIDTIVYLVGKTSGVTLQIPYRIVRKR